MRLPQLQKNRYREGFSITEIAIGLLLMGMIVAATITLFSRMSPRLVIIAAQHEMLNTLEHAHNEAVTSKKEVTIAFYPTEGTYVVDGRQYHAHVPFGIVFDNKGAEEIQNTFVFHFRPDGTATPGTVSLFENDYQRNIHVDGATGKATIANN